MSPSSRATANAAAGKPRLVVATGGSADLGSAAAGGVERTYLLLGELVTLGSADTQDIQVPTAAPQAVEIAWVAERDEWLFSDVTGGENTVNGARAAGWSLHHGDRLDVGDVTFVFQRDEAADHGPDSNGG
jgi:hypothetical protein